jgi:hypothetical protein
LPGKGKDVDPDNMSGRRREATLELALDLPAGFEQPDGPLVLSLCRLQAGQDLEDHRRRQRVVGFIDDAESFDDRPPARSWIPQLLLPLGVCGQGMDEMEPLVDLAIAGDRLLEKRYS